MRIAYCDGRRLRRTLLAADRYVASQRSEMNRINVFPVPDGDTGTNFSLTLQAVADAVRPLRTHSLTEVAAAAARASVLAARGNSGMLFSHYLLGFSESLSRNEDLELRAGTGEMADALTAAARSLHEALERPVEGTMLTVAREVAEEAERKAPDRRDFYEWLGDLVVSARGSVARTREMLPALRAAGVVDAGAKGLAAVFEGAMRYIRGDLSPEPEPSGGEPAAPALGDPISAASAAAGPGGAEGRYCTQIAVRGEHLPSSEEIRERLAGMGTSTIVIRAGDLAKVHIHADEPERVTTLLEEWGQAIGVRVEDTREHRETRRVALVTDSSCNLPHDWLERHRVRVVPLQVTVDGRAYRDGIDLSAERLVDLMRRSPPPELGTSQPAPADFVECYRSALEGGAEEILGIFLGSTLSGTYEGAVRALRSVPGGSAELVDTGTASLGVGMQVVRAAELLDAGEGTETVVEELRRLRDRTGLFFTVDRLDHLLRGGRLSRGRALLGRLLHVKPILTLDAERRVVPCGRARGKEELRRRVMELLDARLRGAERIRLGIAHVGAPEVAEEVEREIRARYRPVEIFSEPAAAVLATHVGPGAWGVFYQIETPMGAPGSGTRAEPVDGRAV